MPQVADSIRIVAPEKFDTVSSPTEVIIAVKPPDEDVAASQIFSAEAVVGSERTPVWLTAPVKVTNAAPALAMRLAQGERAWTFRMTGAPPHAVVNMYASHYLYGATDDNPSLQCRMSVKIPIGGFSTI